MMMMFERVFKDENANKTLERFKSTKVFLREFLQDNYKDNKNESCVCVCDDTWPVLGP